MSYAERTHRYRGVFFGFFNYFYDIFSVSVHNRMLYIKHTHFFPYFLSTIDQKGPKKMKDEKLS